MEQIAKRMVETEEEIILETLVPWCNENTQIQKQMLINKAELKRALNEHYGKNRAAWIYKSFDEDTGISNSLFCSKCGKPKAQAYDNYCGNCGSLMERHNDGEIH